MPLIDRVGGKRMLVWATILQVAVHPVRVLRGELFPTLLRGTAQGFMFGVVGIVFAPDPRARELYEDTQGDAVPA